MNYNLFIEVTVLKSSTNFNIFKRIFLKIERTDYYVKTYFLGIKISEKLRLKKIINNEKNIKKALEQKMQKLQKNFDRVQSKLQFIEKNIYSEKLEEYLSSKNERTTSKLVYTCVIGDKKELPVHTFLNTDFDYICYTDNQEMLEAEQIAQWTIKPLQVSDLPKLDSYLWHKINSHLFLGSYEESIFLSSDIDLITPFLFEQIEKKKKESKILIPRNSVFSCAYEKAEDLMFAKKDEKQNILELVGVMKEAGFPSDFGMFDSDIIYRNHREEQIKKLLNDWWYFIKNYDKNEELSLPFALWGNKIELEQILLPSFRDDFQNYFLVEE